MKATDRVQVTPADLHSLTAQWRAQEWDLQSARHALSTADPTDLPGSISGELAGFLHAWAEAVAGLAGSATQVADGVESGSVDVIAVDRGVANGWR